jgi:hypothetical protein
MRQKTLKNCNFSVFPPKLRGPSPGFRPDHKDYFNPCRQFYGKKFEKNNKYGKVLSIIKKIKFLTLFLNFFSQPRRAYIFFGFFVVLFNNLRKTCKLQYNNAKLTHNNTKLPSAATVVFFSVFWLICPASCARLTACIHPFP